MRSHMDMRDEDELRVTYAKNPDKVTAIFKQAYSFYCPIRKCMLWDDPGIHWNYTKGKRPKGNLDTNDSAKGTKRQKTEQAPPVESDEKLGFEWDEPGLNPVDLTKYKLFLEKVGEEVSDRKRYVEEPGAEGFMILP